MNIVQNVDRWDLDFITSIIGQLPKVSVERYASLMLLEILSGIRKGWTARHVMDRIAGIQSSRLRKKMQEVDLCPSLMGSTSCSNVISIMLKNC
jgi:hypothetical protein